MKICKLNATDSTSLYLKRLMLSESLEDFTVVTAKKQLKGRGQMGTLWESEVGNNLTFSVFKEVRCLACFKSIYDKYVCFNRHI